TAERREAPRQTIMAMCRVRLAGQPEAREWRCVAYNISQVGIGLTVPCPLQPGASGSIVPWDRPHAPPMVARRGRTVAASFFCLCGCALLTPLSEAELAEWIQLDENDDSIDVEDMR